MKPRDANILPPAPPAENFSDDDCDCNVCAYAKKHPQLRMRRCWQPQPVTADTITDEQIREVRLSLARVLDDDDLRSSRRGDWDDAYADFNACDVALSPPQSAVAKRYRVSRKAKAAARARCAEILNARHAKDGAE